MMETCRFQGLENLFIIIIIIITISALRSQVTPGGPIGFC
jgi:hypothetical protein